ncbi:hypothetical protein FRAHR75_130002 [Frankia sp. Hr75.2]|nr:hypothetical protein FRAHR75_130002 [Frankia sp. Hr75.2]
MGWVASLRDLSDARRRDPAAVEAGLDLLVETGPFSPRWVGSRVPGIGDGTALGVRGRGKVASDTPPTPRAGPAVATKAW